MYHICVCIIHWNMCHVYLKNSKTVSPNSLPVLFKITENSLAVVSSPRTNTELQKYSFP